MAKVSIKPGQPQYCLDVKLGIFYIDGSKNRKYDNFMINLDRQTTNAIKGVAILFMLAFHLFAFPERIPDGMFLHSLIPGLQPELHIGRYGHICVAVFLFLSGFGLFQCRITNYLSGAIWRGLKFYCVYLANFILFIGIAYFFFNPLHIQYANWHFDITYTWKAFFENLFLYKISYSGEWWFAELYLLIIFLIYPLCILLSGNVWRYIFLICLSLALFKTGFSSPCNLYYWQLPFVAGFLISMYRHPIERFINAIPGVMTGCPLMQRILVALVGCAAFGVSWILHCHNQFFLAGFEPLNALVFCFAVLMLLWSMEAIHLFSFLGEWSASMWLNHTFFCYYFFPKFIYGLHNPLLIFSVVTIFSILGAFAVYPILRVLNHFEKLIEQHFSAARPADIEHPTGDAV